MSKKESNPPPPEIADTSVFQSPSPQNKQQRASEIVRQLRSLFDICDKLPSYDRSWIICLYEKLHLNYEGECGPTDEEFASQISLSEKSGIERLYGVWIGEPKPSSASEVYENIHDRQRDIIKRWNVEIGRVRACLITIAGEIGADSLAAKLALESLADKLLGTNERIEHFLREPEKEDNG